MTLKLVPPNSKWPLKVVPPSLVSDKVKLSVKKIFGLTRLLESKVRLFPDNEHKDRFSEDMIQLTTATTILAQIAIDQDEIIRNKEETERKKDAAAIKNTDITWKFEDINNRINTGEVDTVMKSIFLLEELHRGYFKDVVMHIILTPIQDGHGQYSENPITQTVIDAIEAIRAEFPEKELMGDIELLTPEELIWRDKISYLTSLFSLVDEVIDQKNTPADLHSIYLNPVVTRKVWELSHILSQEEITQLQLPSRENYQSAVARNLPRVWLEIILGSADPDHFSPDTATTLLDAHMTSFEIILINKRQHEHTGIDTLTWVLGRGPWGKIAEERLRAILARHGKISVAFLDLDFFKPVNDTYGHATGDFVLQVFGDFLRKRLRSTSLIGRYGGEEFVVLLPWDAQSAYATMERIRNEWKAITFQINHDNKDPCIYMGPPPNPNSTKATFNKTVSIGIASNTDEFEWIKNSELTLDIIMKKADKNVYVAKHTGRDRIVFQS